MQSAGALSTCPSALQTLWLSLRLNQSVYSREFVKCQDGQDHCVRKFVVFSSCFSIHVRQ